MERTGEYWRQWLSQGNFPDHPWRAYLQRSALTLKGLTYAPTGALLAAATTSLPETPGGERNWDYRYSWIRDSTFALWACTRSASTARPTTSSSSSPMSPTATPTCRSCTASAASATSTESTLDHLSGYEDARPVRIGNAAYNQQQHDVWGVGARLGLPAHQVAATHCPSSVWPMLMAPGRGGARALAGARPRHLGGARRAAALHLLQADVLGRARPRRAAGPAARGRRCGRTWQAAADEIHADICANGVDERGVFVAALRHDGARRLAAARPAGPLPAARRPAHPGHRAGDRRRADRRRPGAALPGRGDRRRLHRRGGHVHDLLVLAGVGAGGDRRARPGPRACARSCCPTPARSTCTPRRSTPTPAATSATSRRPSPTWR